MKRRKRDVVRERRTKRATGRGYPTTTVCVCTSRYDCDRYVAGTEGVVSDQISQCICLFHPADLDWVACQRCPENQPCEYDFAPRTTPTTTTTTTTSTTTTTTTTTTPPPLDPHNPYGFEVGSAIT